MARPRFKEVWCRIVPRPIERSTFVLVTSGILWLTFWQWRSPPGVVWEVDNVIGKGVLWAIFGLGWVIALVSTYLIDHFDLFGVRQVILYTKGKHYEPTGFRSPFLYKLVRHPLMLGFLIAFWAIPTMTVSHLVFAAAFTVYIVIAVQIEERDLIHFFGADYVEYRRKVPALLPIPKRK
jgi:protein-S-isoprenylcysteine O-methyltransferase Ste14